MTKPPAPRGPGGFVMRAVRPGPPRHRCVTVDAQCRLRGSTARQWTFLYRVSRSSVGRALRGPQAYETWQKPWLQYPPGFLCRYPW